MIDRWRFHHLGVACRSLSVELRHFATLGYRPEGEEFEDPIQKVRGLFITGGGPRLELLSPLTSDSPLGPWLEKGVKLYHHAYEVDSLGESIDYLRAQRGKLVVGPVPAVAFNNREIAFVMLANLHLVELIQTGVVQSEVLDGNG